MRNHHSKKCSQLAVYWYSWREGGLPIKSIEEIKESGPSTTSPPITPALTGSPTCQKTTISACLKHVNQNRKKGLKITVISEHVCIFVEGIGKRALSPLDVPSKCPEISTLLLIFLVLNCSVVSDLLWPHGLQPVRLICPWNFPGKNTGVVATSTPGNILKRAKITLSLDKSHP